MSFDVETSLLADHARIVIRGEFSLPALFEFIECVKSVADEVRRDRILVDAREIANNISEVDRFLAGQRSAEVFGSKIKIAILMPKGTVSKMAELAAVNRGARMLVTDSEAEALEWLPK